jgi:hypothetical protein
VMGIDVDRQMLLLLLLVGIIGIGHLDEIHIHIQCRPLVRMM